jgi:ribosomal protein S28E/S33
MRFDGPGKCLFGGGLAVPGSRPGARLAFMRNRIGRLVSRSAFPVICLALGANAPATSLFAQSVAVANPTYVSIPMEITVDRPAVEVWKRIGKYCDIGEWMQVKCEITAGKDGEFGAVRTVANEVLVGKTELSYTYTQPVAEGRPYNLYHGTLEARPVTATTSKLIYTLVFDNSMLPDDAAREKDIAQRRARFTQLLQNMKILAEGGTLPPARGGARGTGAPR